MLDIILNIAALIVTISILVTFHEYGHYYVARLCNVHVLRFSVGFGKPLWMRHGKAPVEPTDAREDQAAKGNDNDGAMPTRINGTKHPANTDMPIRTRSNEPLPATEFVVAAIPLGGYVKFLDERESFVPDDLKHLAFNRKSVWQRIAIVSAGPLANFLLAIVAYWLLFTIGITGLAPVIGAVEKDSLADKAGLMAGQEIVSVNGEAISNWQEVQIKLFDYVGESGDIVVTARQAGGYKGEHEETEYRMPVQDWLSDADLPFPIKDLGIEIQRPQQAPVLGEITPGSRAAAAGLRTDDTILAVDGADLGSSQQLVQLIQASPDKPMRLQVLREDAQLQITLTPDAIERDGRMMGFAGTEVLAPEAPKSESDFPASMQTHVSYPVHTALIVAVQKTYEMTALTLSALGKMVVGAISTSNLAGPITIAEVAGATAQGGLVQFISFLALLSISLAVINLLPIPVLDGGHLLYCLIELITRRPVPEKVQLWGLQLGMAFLFCIMALAIFNDLMRL